jgi:hypothetical protein
MNMGVAWLVEMDVPIDRVSAGHELVFQKSAHKQDLGFKRPAARQWHDQFAGEPRVGAGKMGLDSIPKPARIV